MRKRENENKRERERKKREGGEDRRNVCLKERWPLP